MTKVSTVNARGQFSEIINRSAYAKERIVLTRRGKEVVAMVPIEDLKFLEKLENRLDLEEIEMALTDPENKKRISWKQIRKDLGL